MSEIEQAAWLLAHGDLSPREEDDLYDFLEWSEDPNPERFEDLWQGVRSGAREIIQRHQHEFLVS